MYKLTGKRYCLIVSIGIYDGGGSRSNAPKDTKRLRKTFEKLGFDCIILCGRVTRGDIDEKIHYLTVDGKLVDTDMIAICVLAHGAASKTLGMSDGEPIHLHELFEVNPNMKH